MTGRWGFDPVIYELNTAAWLHDVGTRTGRPTTLADVPADEWDRVTPPGVDAVWLMGVWRRSAEGVRLALDVTVTPRRLPRHTPRLHAGRRDRLRLQHRRLRRRPAVRRHARSDSCRARALADRGARLIVDFVPNHVAPDHPWLTTHPEYFVRGDAERHRTGTERLPRGR